jgi:glutathione S-transferase
MTLNTSAYRIIATNGSPYSVKMRAIMRYRHLPFIWQMRTSDVAEEIRHLRPQLMPTIQYPDDGSFHLDSTPMIYDLERRHPGQRSIIPDDPGHAFLALLIEDMADEWLTKAMFYYRWIAPADQDWAARWISSDNFPELTGTDKSERQQMITDRQVGRMALVGSTAANAAVIEETFGRFLSALNGRLSGVRYLFGSRPSMAEFGLFGQLWPLGDDPTSCNIMRTQAPELFDWRRFFDDASGVSGDWQDPDAPLDDMVLDLLSIAGDSYFPFLTANQNAVEEDLEWVDVDIRGNPYRQAPFRYQIKCINWLREAYAKLDVTVQARLNPVLEEKGILSYLR